MEEQLIEKDFEQEDAAMIADLMEEALPAKKGDAFAQAKFGNFNQDDRETLSDIFREQGFEETADAIENPVGKIYMALCNFKEENLK